MRSIKTKIAVISFSMLFCSCDRNGHHFIKIINNSNNYIVWQPRSYHTAAEIEEKYNCNFVGGGRIESKSYSELASRTPFETGLSSGYLQINILDGDSISKYLEMSFDTLCKYIPISHSYILTIEDLVRMDFTIVYPSESTNLDKLEK